jgi:hypothetical protein
MAMKLTTRAPQRRVSWMVAEPERFFQRKFAAAEFRKFHA